MAKLSRSQLDREGRSVSSQKRAYFRPIPQPNTREVRPRWVRKAGRVFHAVLTVLHPGPANWMLRVEPSERAGFPIAVPKLGAPDPSHEGTTNHLPFDEPPREIEPNDRVCA
jgi:hypothetical protein